MATVFIAWKQSLENKTQGQEGDFLSLFDWTWLVWIKRVSIQGLINLV